MSDGRAHRVSSPKWTKLPDSKQIGFSFRLKNRPKPFKSERHFQYDYSIIIYFDDSVAVGHKSKYVMSELAQHLMVEGNYSKETEEKHRGRPHNQLEKVGEDEDGKNILRHTTGYKKKWPFVQMAADRHRNWSRKIKDVGRIVHERRMTRSPTNFYNTMRSIAGEIRKNIINVLIGLKAPKLDQKTIDKKGHDKILRETDNLMKALRVKVVKVNPVVRSQLTNLKGGSMDFSKSYIEGSIVDTNMGEIYNSSNGRDTSGHVLFD